MVSVVRGCRIFAGVFVDDLERIVSDCLGLSESCGFDTISSARMALREVGQVVHLSIDHHPAIFWRGMLDNFRDGDSFCSAHIHGLSHEQGFTQEQE